MENSEDGLERTVEFSEELMMSLGQSIKSNLGVHRLSFRSTRSLGR